jgi:hypothetical protein
MKVEQKLVEVEKVVKTVVKEEGITLELSMQEAKVIKSLVGRVSHTDTDAGKITYELYRALEKYIPYVSNDYLLHFEGELRALNFGEKANG